MKRVDVNGVTNRNAANTVGLGLTSGIGPVGVEGRNKTKTALVVLIAAIGSIALLGQLDQLVGFADAFVVAAGLFGVSASMLIFALRAPVRVLTVFAGVGLAAIVCVTAFVYPAVDGRAARGVGTDTDDAITIGVRAVLHGRDPYKQQTYLNNPVAPLPGSFVIGALPVVATRRSGAANAVIWLGFPIALAVLLVKDRGERRTIALRTGAVVLSSAPFWSCLINGSDEFSNGCLLAIAAAAAMNRRVRGLLAALAYSLILLTRTVAPPLVIPTLAYVAAKRGFRSAIAMAVTILAFSMAIMSPWASEILHGTFVPLTVLKDKQVLSGLSPLAYRLITAAGVLASIVVGVSLVRMTNERRRWLVLFVGSAMVIFIPFVLLAILSHQKDFLGYTQIGLPFLMLALVVNETQVNVAPDASI